MQFWQSTCTAPRSYASLTAGSLRRRLSQQLSGLHVQHGRAVFQHTSMIVIHKATGSTEGCRTPDL